MCHISSSCKIMLGIPSFTGNFLPVSGQINHPSTKYTSNNTLEDARCMVYEDKERIQ